MRNLIVNCHGHHERESEGRVSVCMTVFPNDHADISTTLWFTAGEARHVINMLHEAIRDAETPPPPCATCENDAAGCRDVGACAITGNNLEG